MRYGDTGRGAQGQQRHGGVAEVERNTGEGVELVSSGGRRRGVGAGVRKGAEGEDVGQKRDPRALCAIGEGQARRRHLSLSHTPSSTLEAWRAARPPS